MKKKISEEFRMKLHPMKILLGLNKGQKILKKDKLGRKMSSERRRQN